MPSNVCDEINYPFPNVNGCTVQVWEWISNFITHFIMYIIIYPCSKRVPMLLLFHTQSKQQCCEDANDWNAFVDDIKNRSKEF